MPTQVCAIELDRSFQYDNDSQSFQISLKRCYSTPFATLTEVFLSRLQWSNFAPTESFYQQETMVRHHFLVMYTINGLF
jgi:hypothetical protein